MAADRSKRTGTFGLTGITCVAVAVLAVGAVAMMDAKPESEVLDPESRRAREAISELMRGLDDYRADTGHIPRGLESQQNYGWLRGPGAEPRMTPRPSGEPGLLEWFLEKPFMAGDAAWQGPYVERLQRDPWGRCFLVVFPRAEQLEGVPRPPACMVVSAGPDGVIQSDLVSLRPAGDDLVGFVD
jgi:type II secretion system (T2SS) protein G